MAKLYHYEGESITVTYDAKRCIHAKECVHGLPGVFDPEKRPWISPDAAAVDELVAVVERCPTGALTFTRKDGGAEEAPSDANVVTIAADGPLYAAGRLEVRDSAGELLAAEHRAAFCRCGASRNKPYCDGAHVEAGFQAPSAVEAPMLRGGEAASPTLKVKTAKDGPLLVDGPVEVRDAAGTSCEGVGGALCRCGASENKPFCDGSHKGIGFQAD